jgi:hypothetical protein
MEIEGESNITSDPVIVEKVDSRDVPLDVLERFEAYSVGLIGVRRRSVPSGRGPEEFIKTAERRCGCGTLVKTNDRHFILTAAHCARELAKWDDIGVTTSSANNFTIPIGTPTFVGEWQSQEWGPDLAFLPIPPDKVGVINAYTSKVFFNLDKNQEKMLNTSPTLKNCVWVLIGTPDVYSVEHEDALEVKLMAYRLGSVGWSMARGEFDYVHVPMLGSDLPPTFQGVSGGGLWRAEIERNPDGSFASIGDPKLEGCAFYEFALPDQNCLVVRCHGRRSIYQLGLDSLRS